MSPSLGLFPRGSAGWSLAPLFLWRGCAAALGFGLLRGGRGMGKGFTSCFFTDEVGEWDGGRVRLHHLSVVS